MLYLVLVGTGMRIQECVSLRRKDFDLEHEKRIKIEIPAMHTKNTDSTYYICKQGSGNVISDQDLNH